MSFEQRMLMINYYKSIKKLDNKDITT